MNTDVFVLDESASMRWDAVDRGCSLQCIFVLQSNN